MDPHHDLLHCVCIIQEKRTPTLNNNSDFPLSKCLDRERACSLPLMGIVQDSNHMACL